MNWLETAIEPGVRAIVKLLRDNGINTTSSCEHEGYVECDWQQDDEATRVFSLLWKAGHRPFSIEFYYDAYEGMSARRFFIIRLDARLLSGGEKQR